MSVSSQKEEEEKRYNNCTREEQDKFKNYVKSVDVLSCLEFFFTRKYSDKISHFERFPKHGEKRPDFTVLLKDSTGIVGEYARSPPNDEDGFLKEMKQLESYDKDMKILNEKSEYIEPKNYNILYILSTTASSEVVGKIKGLLERGELNFEHDLIIWEVMEGLGDRVPTYAFRHFPSWETTFSSSLMERLNTVLCTENKPIRIRIDQFMPHRISIPFMNDPPPPIYMSVILWETIFSHELSSQTKNLVRKGILNEPIKISLSVRELRDNLNNSYFPIPVIERNWVKNTLEYLVKADLAERSYQEGYVIKYRNILLGPKRRKYFLLHHDAHEFTDDLSTIIIDRYCKPKKERPAQKEKLEPRQQRFF